MSKFRCDYIPCPDYKIPDSEDEDAGLDSLIEAIHLYRNKEISSEELLASLTCVQQIVKNTEAIRKNNEKIYKELIHNFITLRQYIYVCRLRMAEDPELKSLYLEVCELINSNDQSDEVHSVPLTEEEININETIKKYLSNYSSQFYTSNPYLVIKKIIPLVNNWIMKQEELDDIDRHAIMVSRKLTELLCILTFTNPL